MNITFYNHQELKNLKFRKLGDNVLISKNSSIITPETISIGNNSRVDDFCILSGNITIGSHVHISSHCSLFGTMGIFIDDYAGISSQTVIYSVIDDFSGNHMIGPQVPNEYRKLTEGEVTLGKFVQVGASNIIFPTVTLEEGAATGALSLIKNDIPEWSISAGIPAKVIKKREKNIINFHKKMIEKYEN